MGECRVDNCVNKGVNLKDDILLCPTCLAKYKQGERLEITFDAEESESLNHDSHYSKQAIDKGEKYEAEIISRDGGTRMIADVYSVEDAFFIGESALGHAFKKMALAGKRGVKDREKDLLEAINSIKRSIIKGGK